ncbi:hypothetical protein CCM_00688 [Cordyceps militaris CM01]|uniref:Uncharacterized protein n=1 Tax=Cordyceps militaris (strain CM01) TaxID=983644 RepID=G3J5H2_CORMM|nr:uncharacterized protein CCM_00688 [Cordyceps militaris CM01]EGX96033.1 hypothetical protein CCM_00688 [Cordyceps militaris CM01]
MRREKTIRIGIHGAKQRAAINVWRENKAMQARIAHPSYPPSATRRWPRQGPARTITGG